MQHWFIIIYAEKNTHQSVVICSLSTISRFQINALRQLRFPAKPMPSQFKLLSPPPTKCNVFVTKFPPFAMVLVRRSIVVIARRSSRTIKLKLINIVEYLCGYFELHNNILHWWTEYRVEVSHNLYMYLAFTGRPEPGSISII